jgi:hypothetical protein
MSDDEVRGQYSGQPSFNPTPQINSPRGLVGGSNPGRTSLNGPSISKGPEPASITIHRWSDLLLKDVAEFAQRLTQITQEKTGISPEQTPTGMGMPEVSISGPLAAALEHIWRSRAAIEQMNNALNLLERL